MDVMICFRYQFIIIQENNNFKKTDYYCLLLKLDKLASTVVKFFLIVPHSNKDGAPLHSEVGGTLRYATDH